MEYWEESMGANTLQTVLDENEDLKQQLAKANERVKRLELIARGLCHTEGTAIGDKAYSEWIDYQEQLRKEQE